MGLERMSRLVCFRRVNRATILTRTRNWNLKYTVHVFDAEVQIILAAVDLG